MQKEQAVPIRHGRRLNARVRWQMVSATCCGPASVKQQEAPTAGAGVGAEQY